MLHMLVNTHSAESCAFRSDEHRQILPAALASLGEVAEKQGAAVQGAWVNLASHTVFALVDAPDAHALDAIIREAGLIGYTDSRVYAVTPLEQGVATATGSE
jgi:hypothetical protein